MKKLALIVAAFACFSCAGADPAQKYPNMIANLDPVQLGSIEASFDLMFSTKLKSSAINVVFIPRENAVALEFRHDLIRYRQFWNQNARLYFIEALNRYNEDFTAKNLVYKYSKSRAAYGKTKGGLEWENFKFSSTYKSSPIFELGYRFRGQSPYFAVMQRSAKDEKGNTGGKAPMESSAFAMYFTKAQGEALAQLFRQDYLLELIGDNLTDEPPPVSNKPAGDVY